MAQKTLQLIAVNLMYIYARNKTIKIVYLPIEVGKQTKHMYLHESIASDTFCTIFVCFQIVLSLLLSLALIFFSLFVFPALFRSKAFVLYFLCSMDREMVQRPVSMRLFSLLPFRLVPTVYALLHSIQQTLRSVLYRLKIH